MIRKLAVAAVTVATIGGLAATATAGRSLEGSYGGALLVDHEALIHFEVEKKNGALRVNDFNLSDALVQCSDGQSSTAERIENMSVDPEATTFEKALKVNDKGRFKGFDSFFDGDQTWGMNVKGVIDRRGASGTVQFFGDRFDEMTETSTICDTGLHNWRAEVAR